MLLRVSSVGPTFRRCGMVFTSKARIVEVTDEQAEILRAEHQLVVRAARLGESEEVPPAEELAAELQSVREDLRKHASAAGEEIAKLRAQLAEARADAAKARKGCDELAAKLAEAREANAKLTAELAEATAPRPAPNAAPAPAGKPSK